MGTHFEKGSGRKPKNAGTRLYAPSTEEETEDYFEEEELPQDSSEESEDGKASAGEKRKQKRRKAPVVVRQQRELSTFERVVIMACTFVFAAMVIFVLSGYERITRAYADINILTSEIEKVNLHISELNVSIECAVTIEQAEAAAQAAGMTYPTQNQIYSPGERIPLPVSGAVNPAEPSEGNEQPSDTDTESADENEIADENTDNG